MMAPDSSPALASPALPVPAERNQIRGILLIAAGGVLFALMGAMAKAASPTIPTFELVAFRSAVTWAMVELLRRRARVPLVFHDKKMLFSRSFAGFVAIAAYFYSLRYIPLGDAVLLNNASPVLTAIGAVWLLGERMSWTKAAGLLASMGGVWLLVGDRTGALEARGAWIAAASAVASAWALVSLKVATRRNRSMLVVWCLAAACTLGSLLLADGSWVAPDGRELGLLVGTGVAAGGAQLLMTMGYRLLDASEASVYSHINPLFAVAVGAAAFGEWPTSRTWLGGALILGAGAAVAWSQRGHHEPAAATGPRQTA